MAISRQCAKSTAAFIFWATKQFEIAQYNLHVLFCVTLMWNTLSNLFSPSGHSCCELYNWSWLSSHWQVALTSYHLLIFVICFVNENMLWIIWKNNIIFIEYRRLRYLTFDISWWKRHTNNSSTNIPRFIMPVISTVEVIIRNRRIKSLFAQSTKEKRKLD